MGMSLLHLWVAFSILSLLFFSFHSNLFLTFIGREVINLPLSLIWSSPPSISITQCLYCLCCSLFYSCLSLFPTFPPPPQTPVSPLVTCTVPCVFSCDSLDLMFFSIYMLSLLSPKSLYASLIPSCLYSLSLGSPLFLLVLRLPSLIPLFTCNSWTPSVFFHLSPSVFKFLRHLTLFHVWILVLL